VVEPFAVVLLPLLLLWEAVGVARGVVKFMHDREATSS
jgi:hypothetical protein